MPSVLTDLQEHISGLPVLDTHEHLPVREDARNRNTDFLASYAQTYLNNDLLSAGMPSAAFFRVTDSQGGLGERWALAEPWWEKCRWTGYGRALDRTVQALYGQERIDGPSLPALDASFKASLAPGHFRRVLKDTCRIEASLLDIIAQDELDPAAIAADPEFFALVPRIDILVAPGNAGEILRVGRYAGVKAESFGGWLEAVHAALDLWRRAGLRVFKTALAYQRPLRYARAGRAEAEAGFAALMRAGGAPGGAPPPPVPGALGPPLPPPSETGSAFEDYMMHHVLGWLDGRDAVLQVHTGLQAGNGNLLANSDPLLLANLFLAYPRLKFDLFHASYPFWREAGALAKNFPNVYLDMCWTHTLSPAASVRILDEWLDTVPWNKISAFGGDYGFIDAVAGHLALARENVAKTLALRVEDGTASLPEAKKVAEALFYGNPRGLFFGV